MLVETIKAREAIDWSPHHHAFLNPYNGCLMGCPFCYWLSQKGWENRLQIKENIAALLAEYLQNRKEKDFLYLGSVCDPFMEIEKEQGLTLKCLELLKEYEVPLIITTSASSSVILNYLDLLRSMKQRLIVVVEMARIPFIEALNRGEEHQGIVYANVLKAAGVETWATLAPILPGIMDLNEVLKSLDEEIPVYIDHLNCDTKSIQGQRTLAWIQQDYPQLASFYEDIIEKQDWRYFTKIREDMINNQRIKTFPFELD